MILSVSFANPPCHRPSNARHLTQRACGGSPMTWVSSWGRLKASWRSSSPRLQIGSRAPRLLQASGFTRINRTSREEKRRDITSSRVRLLTSRGRLCGAQPSARRTTRRAATGPSRAPSGRHGIETKSRYQPLCCQPPAHTEAPSEHIWGCGRACRRSCWWFSRACFSGRGSRGRPLHRRRREAASARWPLRLPELIFYGELWWIYGGLARPRVLPCCGVYSRLAVMLATCVFFAGGTRSAASKRIPRWILVCGPRPLLRLFRGGFTAGLS